MLLLTTVNPTFNKGILKNVEIWGGGRGGGRVEEEVEKVGRTSRKSINQLYLNRVNGSASWFSDMPCDNYNL